MSRCIELLIALMIFPVIFFLILVCITLMIIFDKRPFFFISERVGKNQKRFKIVKLRTMSLNAPLMPSSNEDAPSYVTKLGKFFRYTSMDELPQIFNILNGTMCFVGPRPCLASQFELIKLRENERIFSIKPGVTGLAQIMGRDKNTDRNKVRLEKFYMKKKSILLDIKIIIMTIRSILKFSDINH